jgi:UDP-N-acetylmuramyl tripeptide synthase
MVLPIPGRHNIQNALAALSMALDVGVDVQSAARALENFVQAPRRLETVTVGDITLVSDVAMNRASYDAVMQFIVELKRPVVVVNAIRGDRGTGVNRDIAEVLGGWSTRIGFVPMIVTLSRQHVDRMPVDYRVRPEETEAFLVAAARRGLAVELFTELPAALDAARGRIAPGGVLLLLGTFGMDDGLALAEQILRQEVVNRTRS